MAESQTNHVSSSYNNIENSNVVPLFKRQEGNIIVVQRSQNEIHAILEERRMGNPWQKETAIRLSGCLNIQDEYLERTVKYIIVELLQNKKEDVKRRIRKLSEQELVSLRAKYQAFEYKNSKSTEKINKVDLALLFSVYCELDKAYQKKRYNSIDEMRAIDLSGYIDLYDEGSEEFKQFVYLTVRYIQGDETGLKFYISRLSKKQINKLRIQFLENIKASTRKELGIPDEDFEILRGVFLALDERHQKLTSKKKVSKTQETKEVKTNTKKYFQK